MYNVARPTDNSPLSRELFVGLATLVIKLVDY